MMSRTFVLALLMMTFLGAAFTTAAPAADPEWYSRQDTWQETVRLSREALARYLDKSPDAMLGGARFGPWYALGPIPAPRGTNGFDHAHPLEQDLDVSKSHDGLRWQRETRADGQWHPDVNMPGGMSVYMQRKVTAPAATKVTVYVGADDQSKLYLNGQHVQTMPNCSRGTPVELELKQGENQLLLKMHNTGGAKGYVFSMTKTITNGPGQDNSPEAQIWGFVQRDFRDAADQRRMRWEREDGVWAADWKPGDLGAIAVSYATATRPQASLDAKAGELAATAKTARDLEAVREIYYRARAIEEMAATVEGLNFTPLRLAINDLSESFGPKYPNGKRYLAQLDALEKLALSAAEEGAAGAEKLAEVVDRYETLRNEALLANPLLDFEKLLLIKRRGNLALPQNWQGNCVMRGGYDNEIATLSPVRPGGELTTVYRPEKNVFVGDVDLHFDAERMLFSMPGEHNRYQVFEIDVDGKNLRQVTPTEQDIDNYDACYLPSEKIIYDSTGCFQGVPCVGGGNQVANLYVINPDGTGIRRLCFDQDHDWCPAVTNDGRVIFARWEYSDTPHYFTRVMMRMNPDGTNQVALYGSNSYWPNSTFYARTIPNHPSKFVGVISGHHGVARMGELIIFDPALGQHEADGVVQRIPGYGKKVEPIIRDQLVNNSWPRFLHPYPLSEKYFLTACQLDSKSPWGVYLVDVFDNFVPICVEPGVAMLEPVPLQKTVRPPVVPEKVDLRRDDAIVSLSDVYAGGGLKGVERGTVKELRLFAFDYGYQGLANHTYIGIEGPWDVHRILGKVKVESDGSSMFRVPANTPIAVQPLDEDGKALQLMRSWFVAMPGETISCTGCHERQTDAPPRHMTIATRKRPQAIEPWFGPARGFSFDREVQPVVDKHCIGCHNDKPYDGRQLSDLRQDDVQSFSRAYRTLQKHVRRPGPESDYHMFPPAEYHADSSPLIQMLDKGHYGVKLDREANERLYTWIDLNVPYYGTWGEFRAIPNGQRERRAELRRLYEGLDVDYEVVPETSAAQVEPIVPEQPDPIEMVKIECPDWPFDDAEARRRQGENREQTISLGTVGDKELSITLVRIPAGEFVMGDWAGGSDQRPPARVQIEKPFWIAKTIITNEQFGLFDPTHDSRYLDRGGKDHSNRGTPLNQPTQPVIRISWDQAMTFCRWLSQKTGRRYSLPTEAQWEFTCRAGARADQSGNGRAWGVDAMAGNTAEWTRSAYRSYPFSSDGRDDGTREGRKVVRGANAIGLPANQRDTYRLSYNWWQGAWNVGFRVVCEDEEPSATIVAKK